MLCLGETDDEVIKTMKDLKVGVSIMTLGQYWRTTKHLPVVEYLYSHLFFKEIGLSLGFRVVESGPLVRSSYHCKNI